MTVWRCGPAGRIRDLVGHNGFSRNVGDEIAVEDLDGCLRATSNVLVQEIRWVDEKEMDLGS